MVPLTLVRPKETNRHRPMACSVCPAICRSICPAQEGFFSEEPKEANAFKANYLIWREHGQLYYKDHSVGNFPYGTFFTNIYKMPKMPKIDIR